MNNAHDNFKEKHITNPKISIDTKINGNIISLSICDNGGGISDDIIDQIFDPYFSTKNEENGTGIGLYMAKIIIEDHHHGILKAINTNEGVCFILELELDKLQV